MHALRAGSRRHPENGCGGIARESLRATALGLPTMMCTCCTAPVVVGRRRAGTSATAFWLANPVLNPAVLVFALLGVLLVIPTGGEIPVLLALAAAGAGPWTLGVALICLSAVSLPSLVMVGRSLTWRVAGAIACLVVAAGILAGALLAV